MRISRVRHCLRAFRRLLLALILSICAWHDPLLREAKALDLEAQKILVNKGIIGVLGDGARGTDFAMIADLAAVLDEGYERRILPMAGTGSVRAIEDLLFMRGVDIAFVQADVLDFYQKADLFPDIEEKVRYLARIYTKEFHLLASKDIGSIEDLEGKRVNFGPPSSGSFLTASLIFDALDITVAVSDDDYQIALDKLRQGEIDAWVRVDAKPSLQLEDLPTGEQVHFLPMPDRGIEAPYVATALTTDDYPELITDGQAITTLAVPTIMATYDWPEKHNKRSQLQAFQNSLSASLGQLQQAPFHAKWREVDLSSDVAGWDRF
ncbi:MAG: TAXI family TRAP transporter solute-binding subunit [Pseudomonadota bacterium]